MALIEIPAAWLRIPTDREEEEGRKFSVYSHYLRATSDVIDETHPTDLDLVSAIADTNAYQRIQVGSKCDDPPAVGKLLRISWYTEAQLRLQAEHSELLPYANHFAPVHAYYAVYHGLGALHAAAGEIIPTDHTAALNAISNRVQNRSGLFPQPWRLLAVGDPDEKKPQLLNVPPGIAPKYVNPLTIPTEDCRMGLVCLFLKTTRKRRLLDRIESWKVREKRKRIRKGQRKALLKNLQPTTLFDCLYRLRIRSNYRDADAMLIGGQLEGPSLTFHRCLVNIVHGTLLVLEVITARYLGVQTYGELVDDFNQYDSRRLGEEGVYRRLEAIQAEV